MPLEKTFWTAKFGMLQDRFGVTWMVSIEHKPGPGASHSRVANELCANGFVCVRLEQRSRNSPVSSLPQTGERPTKCRHCPTRCSHAHATTWSAWAECCY